MRFTTAKIERILPLLQLEEIQWSHGYRPSAEKALCIFTARLSWPLGLHGSDDFKTPSACAVLSRCLMLAGSSVIGVQTSMRTSPGASLQRSTYPTTVLRMHV